MNSTPALWVHRSCYAAIALAWITLLGVVLGCEKRSETAGGRQSAQTPPPAAAPQPPSLDDQALAEAMKHFERHWAKCGDSYYSVLSYDSRVTRNGQSVKERVAIEQWKNPRPYFPRDINRPLTEADRLNGIEWHGAVFFTYSAGRGYFFKDQAGLSTIYGVRGAYKAGWNQWSSPESSGRGWWLLC